MPPRIPIFQCLRAPQIHVPSASRTFTSTTRSQSSTATQRKRNHDPYAIAQAKARKAANLSRQEVLKKERAAALGDPVRGTPTPFVQSFDTALPPEPASQPPSTESSTDGPISTSQSQSDTHLNFYLSSTELSRGLAKSAYLSTPPEHASQRNVELGLAEQDEAQTDLAREQATASEALRRIASLSLGSSKDRLRVNTQRCIDTFGRHNTDRTLPSKPTATTSPANTIDDAQPKRIGPDTGSSEVQIAILTAKIKTLADFLQSRGGMDKVNKRNLRLLVHKRQKLLQYLRRKERGGPRWRNCIETLGLTEGTWRGEISM